MDGDFYKPLNAAEVEIRLLTIPPWKSKSSGVTAKRGKDSPSNSDNSAFAQQLQGQRDKWWVDMCRTFRNMEAHLGITMDGTDITMQTVSLKTNPSFVALSYTWGDPNITEQINVDGRTVKVTTNLLHALYHLQDLEQPVTVWADALCINQQDISERGQQVFIMRLMYEKASSVMVWTGLAANESDQLFPALRDVGKQAKDIGILSVHGKEFQNIFQGYSGGALTHRDKTMKENMEELSEKVGVDFPFRAWKRFEDRQYWKRIWIIQEITVAQDVTIVCGEKRIPFSEFAAAALFISFHQGTYWQRSDPMKFADPAKLPKLQEMVESMGGESSAIYPLIGQRRRFQHQMGPQRTMFEVLRGVYMGDSKGAEQRATDPRDLIYGVLGLASDVNELRITPDYKKRVQDVFTEATRALLKLRYVDILAWSQQPHPSDRMVDLPSWVPDFSKRILKPCYDPETFSLFSASGTKNRAEFKALKSWAYGPDILALKCYKIDTIQVCGDAWHGENGCDFASLATYLDSIERLCDMRRDQNPTGQVNDSNTNWREAPWRIPSGDQELRGSRRRGTEAMHRDFKELRTFLDTPERWEDRRNLSDSCNMYLVALQGQHNRRPFLSSQGYAGLVPAQSERGDEVYIVAGANMPFVFRPVGRFYQLVGEAYVYGMMDGEFLKTDPLAETIYVC